MHPHERRAPDASEVLTSENFRVRMVDGKRQLTPFRPDEYPTLEQAADGLLFIGPKDRTIVADPDTYDEAYRVELRRRGDIYKTVFGYDPDPDIELAITPAPSQRTRGRDPSPAWTDTLRRALAGTRGATRLRALLAEESRRELGAADASWRPDDLDDVRDIRFIARQRVADPELRMRGAIAREVVFYEILTGSATKFLTVWVTGSGRITAWQVTQS